MTTQVETAAAAVPARGWLRAFYRAFGYLGIMSIYGSLLYGFRGSAGAPWSNYGWNAALYGAFIVPHLIMTRGWFQLYLQNGACLLRVLDAIRNFFQAADLLHANLSPGGL